MKTKCREMWMCPQSQVEKATIAARIRHPYLQIVWLSFHSFGTRLSYTHKYRRIWNRPTVGARQLTNAIYGSHSYHLQSCRASVLYTVTTYVTCKWCKAQIPLFASRHDVTSHDTISTTCCASRDVTYVLCVSCVMRRACFNMADDEEAVVLACETISCFIIIYYFSS